MAIQQAYAFLLVALEGGLGVQEYAAHAGTTQTVMSRILSALGPRSRGRQGGFGFVHQAIDTEDIRKHQTFLTAKGKTVIREIARLVQSDQQSSIKLQSHGLTVPPRPIARDQWLTRLIAAGQKLDPEGMQLAVHLVETLVRHRQVHDSNEVS